MLFLKKSLLIHILILYIGFRSNALHVEIMYKLFKLISALAHRSEARRSLYNALALRKFIFIYIPKKIYVLRILYYEQVLGQAVKPSSSEPSQLNLFKGKKKKKEENKRREG